MIDDVLKKVMSVRVNNHPAQSASDNKPKEKGEKNSATRSAEHTLAQKIQRMPGANNATKGATSIMSTRVFIEHLQFLLVSEQKKECRD